MAKRPKTRGTSKKLPLVTARGMPETARWKHEEKTGILVGRLGNGDISNWSHGVSKPFGSQFKPKRPECAGDVLSLSQPITSKGRVKAMESKPVIGPVEITFNPGTPFDESDHAVKVARKTASIQLRLEKAFAKARIGKAPQMPVKGKGKAKARKVPIGKIKPIPGFVPRVPEFLSREPKNEIGPCIPRGKVEPIPYVRPSNGGRAGLVERWGE